MRFVILALLILLAVLLVAVVLLLFLPVWVTVELRHSRLTVRLRVLFLRFTLFPQREKKSEPEKEEAGQQEQGKPPEKKRSPSRRFERTVSRMLTLVRDAAGILRMALGALRVRKIRLVLPLQGTDAADTALFYGRFCGWFYGAIATAQNFLDMEFDQIELIPDFAGENKYRTSFYCKIGATPFIILVVAIKALRILKEDGLLPSKVEDAARQKEKKRPQGSPRAEEDRGEKA